MKTLKLSFIFLISIALTACENSKENNAEQDSAITLNNGKSIKDSAANAPMIEVVDRVNCVLSNESPRCIHVDVPPAETEAFITIFIQDPNFSAYKDHNYNMKMQNVYTGNDLSAVPENSFFASLPWRVGDLHILHSGGIDASWTGTSTFHVTIFEIPYTVLKKYTHTDLSNFEQVNAILKYEPHNFNGAANSSNSETNKENSTPASTSTNSGTAQAPESSYDKTTLYNQGVEDETNCLKGGVTPSISEERAVFDVKFPNGTDADFQNYQNGCQYAFGEWKANSN
jgi:hypothetical protein